MNGPMKLYIKYMVSIRCKMVVKAALDQLGLHYGTIELGEVEVREALTPEQLDQIGAAILKSGLELLDDKRLF